MVSLRVVFDLEQMIENLTNVCSAGARNETSFTDSTFVSASCFAHFENEIVIRSLRTFLISFKMNFWIFQDLELMRERSFENDNFLNQQIPLRGRPFIMSNIFKRFSIPPLVKHLYGFIPLFVNSVLLF